MCEVIFKRSGSNSESGEKIGRIVLELRITLKGYSTTYIVKESILATSIYY